MARSEKGKSAARGARTERRAKARPVEQHGMERRSSNRVTVPVVTAYDQAATPLREWDRGTQFLSVFAISGFISEKTPQGDVTPTRPASVLLVGSPGSGKTELVERFSRCRWLSYHNDLTVRSLLPLLRKADNQILTHVAAPEFNKWFQRKAFVAENCIGLLCGAMEEGIKNYDVGGTHIGFNSARLGLFGGMTPGTMDRRRGMLTEMGFLTRVCAIEWGLPREERNEIMRRINLGITTDVEPIDLVAPTIGERTTIEWDENIGERVVKYIRERWPENDFRILKRFKTIMLSRAYLVGHMKVTDDEWQWMLGYQDYWDRMILGEE